MDNLKNVIGEKNFKKITDYRKNLLNSRQNLIDLLPLNEPLSISLGLTNRCNFGCVFWDWQQAQGGEGSMIAWLYTDPPLAAKDLIHHTSAGYIHIAERFIEALDDAKENYK